MNGKIRNNCQEMHIVSLLIHKNHENLQVNNQNLQNFSKAARLEINEKSTGPYTWVLSV